KVRVLLDQVPAGLVECFDSAVVIGKLIGDGNQVTRRIDLLTHTQLAADSSNRIQGVEPVYITFLLETDDLRLGEARELFQIRTPRQVGCTRSATEQG